MTWSDGSSGKARPELIVVGGSAGALEFVMRLSSELPPSLELPVVVVLHLPRAHPSRLADLLTHSASRPVREARDKDPLMPFDIFVGPPDYHLLIERGPSLALSLDEPVNYSRPAIDVLFESAADVLGSRVLGILLSGANRDGARGLAAIAKAGGEVVVLDPAEAPSRVMPETALDEVPSALRLGIEGIVDHVRALVEQRGTP